jgi:hypothetical protein
MDLKPQEFESEAQFEKFEITEAQAEFKITEEQAKSLRFLWYISAWPGIVHPTYHPDDKELQERLYVSPYLDEGEPPSFFVVFDDSGEGPNYSTLFEALLAAEQLAVERGLIASERHEIGDKTDYDS